MAVVEEHPQIKNMQTFAHKSQMAPLIADHTSRWPRAYAPPSPRNIFPKGKFNIIKPITAATTKTKKIEIWVLYLVVLIGILFAIGFGVLVRQEIVGDTKLGKIDISLISRPAVVSSGVMRSPSCTLALVGL